VRKIGGGDTIEITRAVSLVISIVSTFALATDFSPTAQEITLYRFADGHVSPAEGAEALAAVGSLQKAWVVKAWAAVHADPAQSPPRLNCDSQARCWTRTGHGELGLRAATALSCNAYFRALAQETPEAIRRSTLREAGFSVSGPLSIDASIGLEGRTAAVTISPRRLLEAYADLIVRPWVVRDDVRKEWLDGMRDAAEDGTALDLPFRGLLAKTGTVPTMGKPQWAVSGWALVFDPSGGSGWLAFLPRGTGSQAAAAFGKRIAPELSSLTGKSSPPIRSRDRGTRPSLSRKRGEEEPIRIRLFEALRAESLRARNAGTSPLRRERQGVFEWVGPSGTVDVARGDRLSEGLWELELPRYRLIRRVRGALDASGLPVVLVSSRRDYVEGVIRGELPRASPRRAEELAAAVLRFVATQARHGRDDVCDLSHCARFVGEGPDVEWLSPVRARMSASPADAPVAPYLDDASWQRVRLAARQPGPSLWSAHCGGEPLSAWSVWGSGERDATSCPRHGSSKSASWSRFLPQEVLDALFGADASLETRERNGVRFTRVDAGAVETWMLYDEIHRQLAMRLGWDALPSPPDAYTRAPGGWRATGRGSGHRVGICLAD
jgi:stage II sporulation protein D